MFVSLFVLLVLFLEAFFLYTFKTIFAYASVLLLLIAFIINAENTNYELRTIEKVLFPFVFVAWKKKVVFKNVLVSLSKKRVCVTRIANKGKLSLF